MPLSKAIVGRVWSCVVLVALSAPALGAVLPGAVPGGLSVGEQGDASYTIPIATPAATGGLKPSLALRYNHLAGNGLEDRRRQLHLHGR